MKSTRPSQEIANAPSESMRQAPEDQNPKGKSGENSEPTEGRTAFKDISTSTNKKVKVSQKKVPKIVMATAKPSQADKPSLSMLKAADGAGQREAISDGHANKSEAQGETVGIKSTRAKKLAGKQQRKTRAADFKKK